MKKFIILSLVALLALPAAACLYMGRPHYYVFSAFHRDQMGNTFDQRVNQFWVDYTGDPEVQWEVGNLSYVNLDAFDQSNNTIVKTAVQKRDTEAQNYLKALIAYLKISSDVANESWNYPSKSDLQQRNATLNQLRSRALAYKGSRFKSQYALLVMRTHMLQGNHAANKTYWTTTASKLPASVYRDMMRGIYAGALVNTGNREEACRIYGELGDMQSIKWVMRDKRNLKGIKSEYARDPNSPTLLYLVQDFVNNAQETRDHNFNSESMKWVEATSIYNKDVTAFIAFAKQVVDEGKTTTPALWHSAAGFLSYMLGDYDTACAMLTRAMDMDGTPRMKDNARACRLVAFTQKTAFDRDYYATLTREMNWLKAKIKSDSTDEHYHEVMQRVIYDELVPHFQDAGLTNQVTALLSMGNKEKFENYDGDYASAIEKMTANELLSYIAYVNTPATNDFERMIKSPDMQPGEDDFNDMVGTKFLRQGEFANAIPYLERVPLSFLSQQGISKYAVARDYTRDRWLGRQVVDRTLDDFWSGGTRTMTTNVKLQFCREMVQLLKDYASARGEAKLQTAYTLASRYYQASYRGDCWYLTHYSQSVNDTVQAGEADFVNIALDYLRTAKQSTNLELRQKALFGQAHVTQGELGLSCVYKDYDSNYKLVWTIDRDTPNYPALLELYNFTRQHPGSVAGYVSRCDVLRRFSAMN